MRVQLEPEGRLEVDALGQHPVPVAPHLLEHRIGRASRSGLEQPGPEPAECVQHRQHLRLGLWAEFIDRGRSRRRQFPSGDKSGVPQLAQPLAEQVGGDLRVDDLQVAESHRGVGEIAEQQQRPPVPDDIQPDSDRATLAVRVAHTADQASRPTASQLIAIP